MLTPCTKKKHLYVVLAIHGNGVAILANITTPRKGSDTTCILRPGVHPFIRHRSCVHYEGMIDLTVERLRNEERRETASEYMLKQMQLGAIKSPDSDPELVAIIASQIR